MRGRLAGVLVVLVSLAACEDRDPAILKLDGDTVRASDFRRHVAAVEAQTSGPLSRETVAGLLDAYLEQRALVIEARHQGLLPKDATPEQEIEAVSRLVARVVGTPAASEQEIAAWSAAHPGWLRTPERVSLRQVLVPTLNEARDVKRRVGGNPRSFDSVARALSKGPEAAIGGYMGTFERGQLPAELEDVAFSLPEGQTSDPIVSPLGYHVLRVESRQQARDIPLEEARERIRDWLVRDKRTAAERAFVAKVMARAKVNHEPALRTSGPRS